MKNTRISSPRKMVSCFAMVFVPLWKFLAMNVTQISGACSLIHQKWAWRWFYSTMEINSPPFLWFTQPPWRKVTKVWSYCWERLSMVNLSGSYVISSCGTVTRNAIRLHKNCCFLCKWDGHTKYYCFLCMKDSQDKKNHYVINCGLNEHHWHQGSKMSSVLLLFFQRTFICPFCT
jgi:hypothetical protein